MGEERERERERERRSLAMENIGCDLHESFLRVYQIYGGKKEAFLNLIV